PVPSKLLIFPFALGYQLLNPLLAVKDTLIIDRSLFYPSALEPGIDSFAKGDKLRSHIGQKQQNANTEGYIDPKRLWEQIKDLLSAHSSLGSHPVLMAMMR